MRLLERCMYAGVSKCIANVCSGQAITTDTGFNFGLAAVREPSAAMDAAAAMPGLSPDRPLASIEYDEDFHLSHDSESMREKSLDNIGADLEDTPASSPSEGSDQVEDATAELFQLKPEVVESVSIKAKKRKSVVERVADDGGKYKPEDEEATDGSESKSGRVKTGNARPKRHQKMSNANMSGDGHNPYKPKTEAMGSRISETKSTTLKPSSGQSRALAESTTINNNQPLRPQKSVIKGSVADPLSQNKLAKSQIPDLPPPSISVSPAKSSTARETSPVPAFESGTPVITSFENSLPPLPKMPKSIRLPSGEEIVIPTPAMSRGDEAAGEVMQGLEEELDRTFDWDADVF